MTDDDRPNPLGPLDDLLKAAETAYNLYLSFVAAGFNETQALSLTAHLLIGAMGQGHLG